MNNLADKSILFIIKTMGIGGAEKFTLNLCRHFVKRFKRTAVLSSGGVFVKELKKLGVECFYVDEKIISNKRNLLKLKKEIKTLSSNNHFDIIHCQHRFPLFAAQLFKSNSKIVYTANNEFNDLFQRLVFPHVAVSISPSIHLNLQKTLLISSSKIKQINYGVSLKGINKKTNGKITLGFIGRLIKEKGIYNLLNAFKILSEKNKKLQLIIHGNGIELSSIKKIAEDFSENILIETNIIDEDKLYNEIDLLVLPTYLNEGLPISILEAAARKIPSLSSNKGGVKDFIQHRLTGYILINNSPEQIASQIEEIISDDLKNIGGNAFHLAAKEFNIIKMLEKYEEVYTALLKS